MAQIFKPSANVYARLSIFGALFAVVGLLFAMAAFMRSDYMTNARVAREQPVPFSHRHHVNELGIDCRYCHTSVEKSSNAGIPATQICMNCHSQIWSDSPTLEPVRASWRTGESIEWIKVHDLPDYVYFNHAIHVNRGISCVECHGRIDEMKEVHHAEHLSMAFCLDCHRNPEKALRPNSEVTNLAWKVSGAADADPDLEQIHAGLELKESWSVNPPLSCTGCHR